MPFSPVRALERLIGAGAAVLLATAISGAMFSLLNEGRPLFFVGLALATAFERFADLLLLGWFLAFLLASVVAHLHRLRWVALVCGTGVVVSTLGTWAAVDLTSVPPNDFEIAVLRIPTILLVAGMAAGLIYAAFIAWLDRRRLNQCKTAAPVGAAACDDDMREA